jgi:hypothetical protein
MAPTPVRHSKPWSNPRTANLNGWSSKEIKARVPQSELDAWCLQHFRHFPVAPHPAKGATVRGESRRVDDDVWARQVVTSRPETASVDSTSSVDSTARARLAASTPDAIAKSAATNSAFQPNRFRTSSPRVGCVNPDR